MSSAQSNLVTRPISELLGREGGSGFAGSGVNTAIGNHTASNVDIGFSSVPTGLMDWTRTYNSLDTKIGSVGPGWTTSFSARLVITREGVIVHHDGPVEFHHEDGRVLTFTPDGSGGFRSPQDLDAALEPTDNGGYELALRSGQRWHFDSEGRLTGRSQEGQRVTVDRDVEGKLLRVEHSWGRSLGLFYNDAGQVIRVAASDGRVVSYTYDANGLLESMVDPAGGTTRFGHDSDGVLGEITDPDGVVVLTNTYDDAGRVAHQEFPTGGGVDFTYEAPSGITTVTETPSGGALVFHADPQGRMTEVIDPAGNQATYHYDELGRLTSATTPGGASLSRVYDDRGNLVSNTVGGSTTTWAYDDADRVVDTTDPTGGTTRYEYRGDSRIPTVITDPNGAKTSRTVSDGLITRLIDADGYAVEYRYDAGGEVESAIDSAERITRFRYDSGGNRVELVSPDGTTMRWEHDKLGRVLAHTDPAGGVTGYRYSPGGKLREQIDPTGAVTGFDYDAAGNRTGVTDPTGHRTDFAYDARGKLVRMTNPAGEATHYEYDAFGRLISVTDPLGATSRWGYDADGNRTTVEDPSGITNTRFDERGNPTAVTDVLGETTRYHYDAADRLTRLTGPDGEDWHIAHDAAGNTASITDPTGAKAALEWTPGARLAGTTDPIGRKFGYTRDKAGRVTKVTDPQGGVTHYAYDQHGRRISATTPAGLITRSEYDAAGRIVASVDPRGWITRYEYDEHGRRTARTSPSGVTTRFRHDAAGRLTATIDGNENETRYGYDDAGRLISITDVKGAVTRLAYDEAGRQISATDPLGRTTRRAYDDAGNLVTITDPSGRAQHMSYDAANRLIRWRADDGTEVSYTYDKVGRRASMTDGTGTTRYSYDGVGRLVTVTESDGSVLKAEYDKAGRRTALTYPDGLETTYRYNLNGQLIGLHDSRAGDAVYALDPDGRLLTEQLPGRFARRYDYEQGLLSRFSVLRDGRSVAHTAFTHDPDGRILTQHDDGHFWDYGYDRIGQLISARHWEIQSWPWEPQSHGERREDEEHREHGYWLEDRGDTLGFTYDAAGNRTALRQGEHETRYRYDDADQLIASEAHGLHTEYRYDASGRLVARSNEESRQEIEYDGFGRAVTVTRNSQWPAERIEATYNGDGLATLLVLTNTDERHERESAASVRYQWSHDHIPQILSQRVDPELEDTTRENPGRLSADFSYGYGRTFASWRHGAQPLHRDALGSMVRTEKTEAWAQARGYEPFGTPRRSWDHGYEGHDDDHRRGNESPHPRSPEVPRFGYRGELALGPVIDLRARAYDAGLGRFTTRDPITAENVGPAKAGHPYVYADNDPLNRTDPLGELAHPAFAPGALASLSPMASPITRRRTDANSILASNVTWLAKGRGGDRTSLHTLAVETAEEQIEYQMMAKFGLTWDEAQDASRTEVTVKGASKTGSKDGNVDVVFTHAPDAFLWEVKSETAAGSPQASDALAAGEVNHYARYWRLSPPIPGTNPLPGDALSHPVGISILALKYQVYSLTPAPNGAVLYGPAPRGPVPHPVPVPVPQPQPQPQHRPWYEPLNPGNWDLPDLPDLRPSPGFVEGVATVGAAAAVVAVVVLLAPVGL